MSLEALQHDVTTARNAYALELRICSQRETAPTVLAARRVLDDAEQTLERANARVRAVMDLDDTQRIAARIAAAPNAAAALRIIREADQPDTPAGKVRRITHLDYIGRSRFRATFTCGHVQEITGSTRRLPRQARCLACS